METYANDIYSLPKEDVRVSLEILKQMILDKYPDFHVARGAFHDQVLIPAAIFHAVNQADIRNAFRALSIGDALINPEAVSERAMNRFMANHGITRKTGTPARGTVTIYLRKSIPLVVPAGLVFSVGQLEFVTREVFTIRPTASGNILRNDKILVKERTGEYSFTIPVFAIKIGVAGNILHGTKLTPPKEIANYVKYVVASRDFTDGSDTESNAAVLRRLPVVKSAKTWSSRANIESVLKSAGVMDVSVLGLADPELTSKNNTAEIYVRTRQSLRTKTISAVARCTNKMATVELLPADAAGVYSITAIRSSKNAYKVVNETRKEPYSAKQEITLTFIPVGEDSQLSSANVQLDVLYMPGIPELQEMAEERNSSSLSGRALIKAAVPCLVTVNLTIDKPSADVTIPEDRIREVIRDHINFSGFSGKIAATTLSNMVSSYLGQNMILRKIRLQGNIRRPDGTIVKLSSPDMLEIPNTPEEGITNRTTVFFVENENIVFETI